MSKGIAIVCIGLLALSLSAAGCSDDSSSGTTTSSASSTSSTSGGGSGAGCTATVVIGLYGDATCPDPPLFTYTLDIAKSCSGWSRQKGAETVTDSATRFQCYRDRLCYTQYVSTETCDANTATLRTDKESRTTCVKDETPNIWAKIQSGTEGCPEAPAGFECPLSAPGAAGTTGLAAACAK